MQSIVFKEPFVFKFEINVKPSKIKPMLEKYLIKRFQLERD
jgi:hypothetical protein